MAERARCVRRFVVWPAALLFLMGATSAALAESASEELPVAAPLTSDWEGEITADDLGSVIAPEPTVEPASTIPQIQIVFPPAPPPPAASGRRGSSGSGGGGSYPLLDTVNAERAAAGLAPLSWSQSLASGSSSWSGQMCSDQDATGYAFGSSEWYSAVFRHSSGGGYGENIYTAFGSGMSLGAAHNAWMDSSGHRANILGSGYTQFGVGSCKSASGIYFATERFK